MTRLRPILAVLLSLALLVSGAASAVARAEMASAVYPVICGDLGAEDAPAFDPAGNPLTHRHACPHCLSAGALAQGLPAPDLALLPPPAMPRALALVPAPDTPLPGHPHSRPEARGPPFPI
jgi:hypothetical protein